MDLMFAPLRRYAEFTGRSRRAEYWLFILFQWIVFIVLYAGVAMSGARPEEEITAVGGVFMTLFGIALLAFVVPNLAVGVRRLHDVNMSGWWLLLSIVPFGGLVIFVFSLLPGTKGSNRFGLDPKGPDSAHQTAIVFS